MLVTEYQIHKFSVIPLENTLVSEPPDTRDDAW